ncbi:MAG: GNAT family N-acetyltransferase [Planctomycetes bacterium]|nr:GNAT family N-acetyltransferase [Planctomycetota bacterium]
MNGKNIRINQSITISSSSSRKPFKVHIRNIRKNQAQELASLIELNRKYLAQRFSWVGRYHTVQDALAYIRKTRNASKDGLGVCCSIIRSKNNLVGVVGFNRIDYSRRSVELAYWLSQDETGQGIATQCSMVMIEYAFTKLNLNRVISGVATNNTKSQKVAERLGMKAIGVIKGAEVINGKMIDHKVYCKYKKQQKALDR